MYQHDHMLTVRQDATSCPAQSSKMSVNSSIRAHIRTSCAIGQTVFTTSTVRSISLIFAMLAPASVRLVARSHRIPRGKTGRGSRCAAVVFSSTSRRLRSYLSVATSVCANALRSCLRNRPTNTRDLAFAIRRSQFAASGQAICQRSDLVVRFIKRQHLLGHGFAVLYQSGSCALPTTSNSVHRRAGTPCPPSIFAGPCSAIASVPNDLPVQCRLSP